MMRFRSRIRVELEIGDADLDGFRNLLPDQIYERVRHEPRPWRIASSASSSNDRGRRAHAPQPDQRAASSTRL